jgi:hypothetical protein
MVVSLEFLWGSFGNVGVKNLGIKKEPSKINLMAL